MPRSSGNYAAPASSWSPAVNAAAATLTDWNVLLADLASALTQSVSRDGQSPATANLPMGGFKLTGLAAATVNGDAVRFEQIGTDVLSYLPAGVGAVARTSQSKMRETVSVKDFGAIGDGVVNDSAAIFLAKQRTTGLVYPEGTYSLDAFTNPATPPRLNRGEGTVTLAWKYLSALAWVNFPSDSIWENLRFVCTEPKIGLRASVESADRVSLRNCHFQGFNNGPINDPLEDAWGLYIKTANDITVDTCTFASSGNTDIAVVDDVENLTIINPANTVLGTVSLNVEPNSRGAITKGVHGMNVIGGRFNKVYLQEVENFVYASKNIVFSGSKVDTVLYDGSGVSFNSCNIGQLTNAPDGSGNVYAGDLRINNAVLGSNLLTDPYMFDVIGSGSVSYWNVAVSGGAAIARQNDSDGKYLRFNTAKVSGFAYAVLRANITVTPGETLIVFLRSRVDNTSIAGVNVHNLSANWKTAGGAAVSTTLVKCARTLAATDSGWHNDVAVLIPPATATRCQIAIGLGDALLCTVDVASAGLFRVSLNEESLGNWDSVMGDLSRSITLSDYRQSAFPTGAPSAGYFVGERVVNTAPAVGQPKAWTCTVSGAPGTWVSEGNL